MGAVVQPLLPVFGVILLGCLLRRFRFPGGSFWPLADRLTYVVLFPALLVVNLAKAELQAVDLLSLGVSLAGGIVAVSLLLLAARRALRVDGPAFTSFFQGSIRHNTFAGLAACAALYAPPGVTVAAAAIAVLIAIVNLLSIGVLSHFSPGSSHGLRKMLILVLLNPLILACAAGILLNMTDTGLRYGSDTLLEALGRTALPLGLLSVGAGLGGFLGRAVVLPLAVSGGNKLLLLPLIVLLLCRVTRAGGMETAVAVLFAALPAPASAYVLAGQLGGDTRLMAALITGETLLAAVTLPAIVAWSAPWI